MTHPSATILCIKFFFTDTNKNGPPEGFFGLVVVTVLRGAQQGRRDRLCPAARLCTCWAQRAFNVSSNWMSCLNPLTRRCFTTCYTYCCYCIMNGCLWATVARCWTCVLRRLIAMSRRTLTIAPIWRREVETDTTRLEKQNKTQTIEFSQQWIFSLNVFD